MSAGRGHIPKSVDHLTLPSPARVYNHCLGGKDSFGVGRTTTGDLYAEVPELFIEHGCSPMTFRPSPGLHFRDP